MKGRSSWCLGLVATAVVGCGDPYGGAYEDESSSGDGEDFRAAPGYSGSTTYGSSSSSSTTYGTSSSSTTYGTSSSSTTYGTSSSSSGSSYSTGSTYSSGDDTDDDCDSNDDCDDDNVCTDDVCSSGDCTHPPVADGTECDDDDDACTKDECSAGACEHPDEDDGTACEDEPDADTEDKCCAGACQHYCSGNLDETYTAPLMDPQYGDRNGDGVVNSTDQCQLGTLTATLTGPGEGANADGAEYTLTVTLAMLGPNDASLPAHCRAGSPEGGVAGQVILQGIAQQGTIPGLTYDPATGTGTITRKGSTTCDGGTVDLSLDYDIAGNVFFISASVDVDVDDCCLIEGVGADLGPLIFHHAP